MSRRPDPEDRTRADHREDSEGPGVLTLVIAVLLVGGIAIGALVVFGSQIDPVLSHVSGTI